MRVRNYKYSHNELFANNWAGRPATPFCRFCGASLRRTFVDLGMSPLCETYPSAADLNAGKSTIHSTSMSVTVFPGATGGIRECREHLHRLRVFLIVFGLVVETRRELL